MEKEAMGSILDFTGKGLSKIEFVRNVNPTTIIYDNNAVSKLENLEEYGRVQELSAADNRIVRMNGVEKLKTLRMLNLPNNSIVSIEGLQELRYLTWLNLSGNSIKAIENLSGNINLQHLDLSDNCISTLSDISPLLQLRALLLHGNMISSVKKISELLPSSIVALSLAENELNNLSEIACLSNLDQLEQLSVMNNPMTTTITFDPSFDYRPLVIAHCVNLKVLDGTIISEKERLKTEWLYNPVTQNQSNTDDNKFGINGTLDNGVDKQRGFEEIISQQGLSFDSSQIDSIELTAVETETSLPIYDSRLAGKPRAAWCKQDGVVTLAVSPQTDTEAHTSAEWTEDFSDLLASESVYLPVVSSVSPPLSSENSIPAHQSDKQKVPFFYNRSHQESLTERNLSQKKSQVEKAKSLRANKPNTEHLQQFQKRLDKDVPRGGNPAENRSFIQRVQSEVESARLPARPTHQVSITSECNNRSKFDSYEKRTIKPLNQEIVRNRVPAQSHHKPKMEGKTENKINNRKILNCGSEALKSDLTSLKTKEPDSPSVRSHALLHIKDVAESRKNMRKSKSQQQQQLTSEEGVRKDGTNLGKRLVREAWQAGGVRDSGFLSRPNSDAVEIDNHDQETAAATKIQCVWRGYWARQYKPDVKWVREEMRRRRMEDHIVFLRAELERQKLLYREEKQLRNLQLEAIKHLWKEVQVLQNWKAGMLSEQASCNRQKHLNKELENTMEKIEVISEQGYIGEGPVTSSSTREMMASKQRELEHTCAYLHSQVLQLHQTLQGVSHIIHSNSLLSQAFQDPCRGSRGGSLHVTAANSPIETPVTDQETHWRLVSASHYPDEENDHIFQVPLPGCPTQPSHLRLLHHGAHSLSLNWQHSKLLDISQQEISQPLLGYRIYVNDVPYGMVPGHQTTAVVEGLDRRLTYKFHVRGVSSIGDSQKSNIVMAEPSDQSMGALSSSSDSPTDNSDDEHGSTGSLSDDGRKRKADHSVVRTKKKSPRREKEVRRSVEKKSADSTAIADDPSRKDSSSADEMTIYRYPRLHTPKRTGRNKSPDSVTSYDLQLVSCDNDLVSSDADAHVRSRPPKSSQILVKMDENRLKTTDNTQYSSSPKSHTSTDSSPKQADDSADLSARQRRTRSKESCQSTAHDAPDNTVPVNGENILELSATALSDKDSENMMKETAQADKSQKSCARDSQTEKTSGALSKNSAVKTDACTSDNIPGLTLSKPKPLPSAKRKPLSEQTSLHCGSVVPDTAAVVKTAPTERRRTPVVDILEQRFASKLNSTQDCSSGYKPLTLGPTAGTSLPKMKTVDVNLSPVANEDDLRRSKSENSSPTEKIQPVVATGSDSDSAAPFSIKSRTQGSFVSKLLQKLQTFSKAQEQSIRQSQKTMKSRVKSSSDTALAGCDGEDSWSGRRRKISGGEDSEEEARAVLSDSSHCPPPSEKKKANKGHRRSSSMHGAAPFVAKETPSVETAYSPIIMDGGRKKVSPSAGSGSVRRHASFHGILPSKGQEIRQPSEDNSTGKMRTAPKPAPTESSGQPTFRSRSPSPNASARSGVYQPVLSAAQLQRLKSPAGIGH